jgi:GH24 family phage-related lysozyme (muramidase)
VKSLSDIVIPIEAAMKVYNEVMIPIHTFRTERCFENTAELNDLCMGALVSLVFNRGPGLGAADSRREMRNIAAHMKARDFAKVPAEIRAMKRIWEGQEKLRGLCTRRDREAALFEDGLKQTAALVA